MAQDRPGWAPESVDLDRPNAARIYDYLLGGAANFEADRRFADHLLELMPEAWGAAIRNREFLRRAVRFCVEAGVRQFLDLGSGVPTAGNVHEIAQALEPDCTVLYVDSETVAVTHAQAMLADNPRAASIQADLLDVDTVLGSPEAGRLLDFDRPVAVLLLAVLHFVPDSAQPHAAVARYVARMATGSLLAVSHAAAHLTPDRVSEIKRLYERSADQGFLRDEEEFTRFFTGTELVEPGVVWTPQWRPEPDSVVERPETSLLYAGVGRKP